MVIKRNLAVIVNPMLCSPDITHGLWAKSCILFPLSHFFNYFYNRKMPKTHDIALLLCFPVHLQRPPLQQLHKKKQQTALVRPDT